MSHDAGLGGASRALIELVDALQSLGIRCQVVVPGKGPLLHELRQLGVGVSWLPCPWWAGQAAAPWDRLGRSAATLLMLAPFVARFATLGCDVVYTNTITVPVGAMAAKLMRIPHVWHVHEFGYEHHRLRFDLGFQGTAWCVDRLSAAVVAVSEALAAKLRPLLSPAKLQVVYQSVTVRPDPQAEEAAWRDRAQSGRAFRAIVVGEVTEAKGQADAVRAIGELVRDGIDAELLLVGEVNRLYGPHLKRLVAELGLEGRVRFTGTVTNPYPLLRTADVALMCSRYEGFGRVTVEAMLAGKPVVGARSGATPELVRDGVEGLLYAPGDFRELAQHLRLLFEHPQLAMQMGANGYRVARERFTKERYGRAVADVLAQVVSYPYPPTSEASPGRAKPVQGGVRRVRPVGGGAGDNPQLDR